MFNCALQISVVNINFSDWFLSLFWAADYQKRINACKQNIEEAETEVVTDAELDRLQYELEEAIQEQQSIHQELR